MNRPPPCTLLGRGTRVGDYEYELRRDDAVIATGRIQLDQAPTPGDELVLGSTRAHVEDVLPLRDGPRIILRQA